MSPRHCISTIHDPRPSIGSVGDAYDNALAETTIGLYKTEYVDEPDSPSRIGSTFRTVADMEQATSAWVHWYNTSRLIHRPGRIPPAKHEAAYHATHDQPVTHK